jgi:hypothetical protein
MATDTCMCARIKVGHELTELRNLNLDCPLHGTDSSWWNLPEQVAHRQEQDDRLRILQAKAKAVRELGRGCHGRPVELLEPVGECAVCDLARVTVDRWQKQWPVK